MAIGLLVSLLILSTGFQCVYAIKATRDWANPVVFFCGLHLVHNWITSLFYSIDDSYELGGVLIDITDEMIAANLTRNLIGLWTFFAVFLLCKKWWKEKAKTPVSIWILPKHKSLNLFWGLYIVFTALGVIAGSRGGDQALTAGEAFSGLFGILGLRSFFLMFALIQEGFRKKFLPLLVVFPVEFLLARSKKASADDITGLAFRIRLCPGENNLSRRLDFFRQASFLDADSCLLDLVSDGCETLIQRGSICLFWGSARS